MTKQHLPVALCVLNTLISGASEPWDRGLISDHATKLGYKVPRVIDLARVALESLIAECAEHGAVAVVLPSLDHLSISALKTLQAAELDVATVYPEIARHDTVKPGAH
ncbi:hypothetical protein [Nocardia sp. NPDC058480]|uniref:hypothetical protein n=1 Tax=Nocardia sp. NPDC058480 TaxID=3346522 RepID=UPI003659F868